MFFPEKGDLSDAEVANPKSEALNPKQYPMIQIQMIKTMEPCFCFGRWSICILILFRNRGPTRSVRSPSEARTISDFDIRI